MKKDFLVLLIIVTSSVVFSGCGKANDPSSDKMDGDIVDLLEAQQEIAEDYDPNDPDDVQAMMDLYANYGAQAELEDYENTEAVDPPKYFPTSLIYSEGKITESSDYGDESYIDKSITIETTNDMKTVKEFYKSLFSELTWTLVSQSSDGSSASYNATDSAAIDASVYIYTSIYSELVSISVTYAGYITE